jgi:hypothetical protein
VNHSAFPVCAFQVVTVEPRCVIVQRSNQNSIPSLSWRRS